MRLTRLARLGVATGAVFALGVIAAAPSYAVHQTVTGLTNQTPSQIVQFAVGTPGTLANGPSAITFPAGATDTDLVGVDYRPRSSELFAQGSMGTIYTLVPPAAFPGNWTATQITAAPVPNQFTGTPVGYGLDFNPAADRIRIVDTEPGGGASNNNFRYRPDNGQPAISPSDGDLAYGVTDPNFGTAPQVAAAAYTDNIDTTPQTTLFGLDAGTDRLVRQGGVNGSPSPNLGELTTIGSGLIPPAGPPALNFEPDAGFDIEGGTGTAYASLRQVADMQSTFYRVNLTTGDLLTTASAPATPPAAIGPGGTPPIESVSLVPASVLRFPDSVTSVAENGGTVDVVIVREGPLNRITTVNVASEIAVGDTATAADFTALPPTMVTFPVGNARQTVSVAITDDALDESAETFTLRLSGPNVASNLQTPPTAQVQIVDDEATPGALTALVNVPAQTLKKVLASKEVRYSYSCDQECTEDTELRFRSTVLGANQSGLAATGKSNQTIDLAGDARKGLRTLPGKKPIRLKLVSTFTDAASNEQTITTKFVLPR